MWGPLLGWCALELLAESIDAESPQRVALDLFDRLRLREPFARAFGALGFEGEEGWRVAARIKVLLLTHSGMLKSEDVAADVEGTASVEAPQDAAAQAEAAIPAADSGYATPDEPEANRDERVALSPELWLDADVRWLTGVHEAEGRAYMVREPYEELVWWLLMPSLLRLAGDTAPSRAAAEEMSKTVGEALATAEAAGYRIDTLLGTAAGAEAGTIAAPEAEGQTIEPEGPHIELN
jgi:hypothetical protein